ncbi:MAG TPA: radical SAM protein [Spirochaetota bacterium]|nr:radical SAM protein [Spirochaetota bacterium]HOS33446.1 radical SAM protein [Spirochaetota bacterium]HOS56389.1 radical SAM protein [Spirochaetota bacterium]HPK62215.1 radical SAM protein [Spirochaetota bacterium]HQF78896.1 radical SAM protein [Spirochaetota bacterium]
MNNEETYGQVGPPEDFRDFSLDSLDGIFAANKFSADKIKNFFLQLKRQKISSLSELKNVKNISAIINLLPFKTLDVVSSVKDKDNNEKIVFKTTDGFFIESVLMRSKKKISICVSVQIGCKIGCNFCTTAKIGFVRNLSAWEIMEQIRIIYSTKIYPDRLSCVSIMGMGEPFDNLENVFKAVEWMNSSYGYQISREKITISTSGFIPFDNFLLYPKPTNLAVSLHSAKEEVRSKIMNKSPISLEKLKKYMIEYVKRSGIAITVEYCLINGLNDSDSDAIELSEFLSDLFCKVNILNFNTTIVGKTTNDSAPDLRASRASFFKSVTNDKIRRFVDILKSRGIPTDALQKKSCDRYRSRMRSVGI